MTASDRLSCDYLIIGSGLAGLSAALKASQHGSVIVVTKADADECNTRYAQGGIACVIAEGDTFEAHVQDTLVAGAGLCHEDIVRDIVAAGPERIRDLQEWGVRFTLRGELESNLRQEEAADFDLGREGGHSQRRILHSGDITGREVLRVLLDRCRATPGITILEKHLAVDLISTRHIEWQGENCCLGAYVMDTASRKIIEASTLDLVTMDDASF